MDREFDLYTHARSAPLFIRRLCKYILLFLLLARPTHLLAPRAEWLDPEIRAYIAVNVTRAEYVSATIRVLWGIPDNEHNDTMPV